MNDKYVLCFRGINSKGKEEILKIYEASLSNIDKYTCYKGCYSSNDLYRLLPPEIKNYILTFKHNYDFEDDELDDFLGPVKPNDPRYWSIN